MADGHLYHGANGTTGDIGHIQLNRERAPLCRCGKVGCIEAHAAGWAIARELPSRQRIRTRRVWLPMS
ncbi:ROK family protein [uncultured Martelella sp.]|uniref:ROK family protein n=1 Tax=uncultured Martelella sp. TaxID=392331 RepID=UPI0029C8A86E|nr:ROK family protein [uncultured Martelella sp.]